MTIQQLRIDEIFDHNPNAFHARFRDQRMPIMARCGFRILTTWDATGEGGRGSCTSSSGPTRPAAMFG